MRGFRDHFSAHASEYARHRPTYPPELFSYLASLTPEHERAWDCGTGNGQAAIGLAPYYREVIATDASSAQIDNAPAHPKVSYRVAPAEEAGIESGSCDLVAVAQAVHWFDISRFFDEARRVLKPGGAIAVWCYTLSEISPDIDAIVKTFYYETVGPYWPDKFELVDDGYRSLAFPFEELKPPSMSIEREWNMEDMLDFIRTWSPTRRFVAANGYDPTELIVEPLTRAWGNREKRRPVRWPVHMRVGRVVHRVEC